MLDSATDAAFLRTILANPDDDAPRLIYADWLDEQGDVDRAELIRLQVQLSRMSPGEPACGEMYERARELRQAHHVEWVNRLPQFDHVHWEIFERGFIVAVRFDNPDAFFTHERQVFAAAPIYELRVHQFNWPDATRLADSRNLRHIRVLDFGDGNQIGNKGTEGLVKSPHLASLTSLNLRHNSFGQAGIREIAMAPYLRSLRELRLDRNDLYDDAMTFLATSSNLKHLEMLDMDGTSTGDAGIMALAKSAQITQLRSLYLSNNQISGQGIASLFGSAVFANVRVLFLNANRIGDAGIAALVQSPYTTKLERLYLRRNHISDEGAFALSRWPRARHLRELHIGENRISGLGASELQSHLGKAVNVH